jgi:hypothetical protein
VSHTRSRRKEAPGNLIFFGGDVVSLPADEVAAFPRK